MKHCWDVEAANRFNPTFLHPAGWLIPLTKSVISRFFIHRVCPLVTGGKKHVIIHLLTRTNHQVHLKTSENQWIGLREISRKPWFLPSNIGLSCKFPIIQFYEKNSKTRLIHGDVHQRICQLATQSRGNIISFLPAKKLRANQGYGNAKMEKVWKGDISCTLPYLTISYHILPLFLHF